jgi:hypothetical protein
MEEQKTLSYLCRQLLALVGYVLRQTLPVTVLVLLGVAVAVLVGTGLTSPALGSVSSWGYGAVLGSCVVAGGLLSVALIWTSSVTTAWAASGATLAITRREAETLDTIGGPSIVSSTMCSRVIQYGVASGLFQTLLSICGTCGLSFVALRLCLLLHTSHASLGIEPNKVSFLSLASEVGGAVTLGQAAGFLTTMMPSISSSQSLELIFDAFSMEMVPYRPSLLQCVNALHGEGSGLASNLVQTVGNTVFAYLLMLRLIENVEMKSLTGLFLPHLVVALASLVSSIVWFAVTRTEIISGQAWVRRARLGTLLSVLLTIGLMYPLLLIAFPDELHTLQDLVDDVDHTYLTRLAAWGLLAGGAGTGWLLQLLVEWWTSPQYPILRGVAKSCDAGTPPAYLSVLVSATYAQSIILVVVLAVLYGAFATAGFYGLMLVSLGAQVTTFSVSVINGVSRVANLCKFLAAVAGLEQEFMDPLELLTSKCDTAACSAYGFIGISSSLVALNLIIAFAVQSDLYNTTLLNLKIFPFLILGVAVIQLLHGLQLHCIGSTITARYEQVKAFVLGLDLLGSRKTTSLSSARSLPMEEFDGTGAMHRRGPGGSTSLRSEYDDRHLEKELLPAPVAGDHSGEYGDTHDSLSVPGVKEALDLLVRKAVWCSFGTILVTVATSFTIGFAAGCQSIVGFLLGVGMMALETSIGSSLKGCSAANAKHYILQGGLLHESDAGRFGFHHRSAVILSSITAPNRAVLAQSSAMLVKFLFLLCIVYANVFKYSDKGRP